MSTPPRRRERETSGRAPLVCAVTDTVSKADVERELVERRGCRNVPDGTDEGAAVGRAATDALAVHLRDGADTTANDMLQDHAPDDTRLVSAGLHQRTAIQMIRPPECSPRCDPDHLTTGPILTTNRWEEHAQLDRQRRRGAVPLEYAFAGDPLERDGAVLEPRWVVPLPRNVVHELELTHELEIT